MQEDKALRRLIRKPEVRTITGLSDSEISRQIRAGEFPAPVPLSEKGRAVAWLESEVQEFVESRIAKRGEHADRRADLGKRLADARAAARNRRNV